MELHCQRCERTVHACYEHPRARKWARGYFLLPIPFIPVLPIICAEFSVCIPMLMVYLVGIGPILAILREPPLCEDCGAIVPST